MAARALHRLSGKPNPAARWNHHRPGAWGFGSVDVKELEEDPFNAYFVARK